MFSPFFFFNDTATTEIYTLSLHDALPISGDSGPVKVERRTRQPGSFGPAQDRKSTRLNSSHLVISYAVFCLKKKNSRTVMRRHYSNGSLVTMRRPHPRPRAANTLATGLRR